MAILTDDCDLRDVRMQTLMGGNGDYYITLYEYPRESCENYHMISYRMAMSGGFTRKYPEVREAFVALYRAMEAAGLNEFPNGGGANSEVICKDCGGDGIAVCTNPDHDFYDMLSATSHGVERSRCPACGYNEDHKIKFFIGFKDGQDQYKTEPCEICNGTGKLTEVKMSNAAAPEQILIANVRAMRCLQKEYFKTRSSDVLARCKQAEKEVDRALQALSERQEVIYYE